MDIAFQDIVAFVTDYVAYYIKAYTSYKLLNVFINSYHVMGLAHILNLIGEVFSYWPAFDDVTQLITFINSVFFKKLTEKVIP